MRNAHAHTHVRALDPDPRPKAKAIFHATAVRARRTWDNCAISRARFPELESYLWRVKKVGETASFTCIIEGGTENQHGRENKTQKEKVKTLRPPSVRYVLLVEVCSSTP